MDQQNLSRFGNINSNNNNNSNSNSNSNIILCFAITSIVTLVSEQLNKFVRYTQKEEAFVFMAILLSRKI
jgi:hypothetical protein